MLSRISSTIILSNVFISTRKKTFSEWNDNWDLRNNRENQSKIIHRIVLVRHGQYVHGSTDKERVLTDLGKEQAIICGKRLQALVDKGILFPIKYCYYSTMARATETHNLIMSNIIEKPIHDEPCTLIREGAPCQPNPPSLSWKPSEESFFKDNKRIEAGFVNHCHRPDNEEKSNYTTLLVCHGNVIRYFVCRALQIAPENWLRFSVYNASITILDVYSNGRISLKVMGDVGFLEADKVTYE